MLLRHRHENRTINAKHYDSEPVVCQTKNLAREIPQRDRENTFNQVQTAKILVPLLDNLMNVKRCMVILYR